MRRAFSPVLGRLDSDISPSTRLSATRPNSGLCLRLAAYKNGCQFPYKKGVINQNPPSVLDTFRSCPAKICPIH